MQHLEMYCIQQVVGCSCTLYAGHGLHRVLIFRDLLQFFFGATVVEKQSEELDPKTAIFMIS